MADDVQWFVWHRLLMIVTWLCTVGGVVSIGQHVFVVNCLSKCSDRNMKVLLPAQGNMTDDQQTDMKANRKVTHSLVHNFNKGEQTYKE